MEGVGKFIFARFGFFFWRQFVPKSSEGRLPAAFPQPRAVPKTSPRAETSPN